MNTIIQANGLSKIFKGKIKAVDNIDLSVFEGEIFGLLGPNGAGKSTTIGLLTTLIKPSNGSATLAGIDVIRHPYNVRLAIGYVSQDLAVDDSLTGYENLRLQAGFYHIPRTLALKRIDEVLQMVELNDRAKDKVETYSGGMRKRLDIACGLIHRPKIFFLDEPTLGLDIQTRREIWNYINFLRSEINMTVFLTTHYMDEADSLCDRIAIIDKGVIKAMGAPHQLKRNLGKEIVEFKLDSDDFSLIDSVSYKIKSLNFIKDYIQTSKQSFKATVDNGDSSIPAIFDAVKGLPVKIASISFKQPSLDDVFLHYTGKEMRDNGGSKDSAWKSRIVMRRSRG